MGTRARIAIKHPVLGTYASIYTHWDGYPSHHGPILLEHYNTYDKVCELMALGDLSSLGKRVGEKHPFDSPHKFGTPEWEAWREQYEGMCLAYGRDRGETGTEAEVSPTLGALKNLTQECGGEHLYLFDDGVWYHAEGGVGFFGMPASEAPGALQRLDEVVAALKETAQ